MSADQLRIGDAEREQAAAALGEHYAQGRLSAEEHAERLDRVWLARTRADLKPLFRDLPDGSPLDLAAPRRTPAAGSGRRPTYWSGRSERRGPPGPLLVVLAVLLVLTVATHLPLILAGLLVALFVLTRRHRWKSHRPYARR